MSKPPLRIIHEGDDAPRWPEELKYSIDVFDARENLTEVLGRLADLDLALTVFMAAVVKFPGKRIFLRDGARVIRRSDELKR